MNVDNQVIHGMTARAVAYALLVVLAACGGETQPVAERQRAEAPAAVRMYMIEAQRAFDRGDYLTALVLSDSVEARAPDLADLHAFRGRVYTTLKRYDVAEKAYGRALEIDPHYWGAHFSLGINHFRIGALREAIEAYRAEERVAAPSPALYLELGRAYAKLGVADSAEGAYRQALALNPENATAHMWLGQLFEDLGELDSALVHSRAGLALRPEDPDYRYIVGTQLYRQGALAAAAEHLRPVAKAQPWHHGAQHNLAQVLLRLGEDAEAERFRRQASAAQQLQQAMSDAEEATQHAPNDPQHWSALGNAYRQAGRLGRAVEAYQVAMVLDPHNLFLQNNLANLLHADGRVEGALRRYRTILRLDPALPDVWLNLGVAYASVDSMAAARRAWQEVLRQRPGDSTAIQYLRLLDQRASAP